MRTTTRNKPFANFAPLALSLCLAPAAFGAMSPAQPLVPTGKPPAADFNRLHTYEEMAGYLKGYAAAYPGWAKLESIGKSIEGRDLWMLTITNPATGGDLAKPAMYIDGNTHANEVQGAETALYTVADLSRVWVIADVFEYESVGVRIGMPAVMTLSYLPGRTFRGKVNYILPQVDAATRTIKVRIEFPNADFALKPDMYGEVEFQTGGGRRLVVPQTAVLNSGDRQVVFVDRGKGYFEPREVKLGGRSEGRVEILSGLQPGERIVISGNFLIDSESQLKTSLGGASK